MIVLVHDFHKVKKIEGVSEAEYKIITQEVSIAKSIYLLASNYPSEVIVWCNESYYSKLNRAFIENAFLHNRYMYSYNPMGNFFSDAIGYVEESPFININKQVCYPTWQMSSVVGAMQSSTILLLSKSYWGISSNLDYVLNTVAKLYQPLGLFCYSEPMLLVDSKFQIDYPKATSKELFSFVAQQYKWVWKHFLLFCFFIFEKRFCFLSWLLSLFQSQLKPQKETIVFEQPQKTIDWELETIDVIIPTIGRKKYLYDVLKDLSVQTHLPKNVIIVEQNPNPDSNSELDYLTTEQWPFQIKHVFTHQTGACQARNKALDLLESKWCFFNDDDNRFDDMIRKHEFLEYAECHGNRYGTSKKAVNDLLENNFDVILEIDWQGANSIRKLYPEAVSIFIMPPSIEDLEKRLKGRNQDSEEVIQSRMKSAIEEISHADEFDYVTINNKIEDTVQELQKIIEQKINKL